MNDPNKRIDVNLSSVRTRKLNPEISCKLNVLFDVLVAEFEGRIAAETRRGEQSEETKSINSK